ncbi:MAG TPA: histidine phosphatase family protein [Syntrophorhabdaceae bacterium]|nr:histidine phosphatase family protein [Syntrophorhabdaceae bacterium]
MYIYLVRHGQTGEGAQEIFRGKKDIPLNALGREQAERTGDYFSDKRIGRILASPLERAWHTAKKISQIARVPVEKVEGLSDMSFGAWEGLTLNEVQKRYPGDFEKWRNTPHKLKIPGGESLSIVRRRLAETLGVLLSKREDDVVLVTHRIILKLAVLHLLNISSSHFWDMQFDPGSVTLLKNKDGRTTVLVSNETCHLKSAPHSRA